MKLNKNNYRYDFPIIANWVDSNSKVLDLGCGDGELLNYLKKERNITGYGIEKDPNNWLKSLKKGINVLQVDIEAGLPEFEDNSFDVVILSKTIQSMHNTEEILDEMLRVGKQVIVTFPNFGYWRDRIQSIKGVMPKSKELPYSWFNTPNVHLCTIKDFDDLCKSNAYKIVDRLVLTDNKSVSFFPNLLGALALYNLVKR
ncbi:methionine biosynthesis protein MetW [Methylophilaceae bacterium]|nr:methionine biosynthesis protein MetW [Methylophilaceae bacterium]